MNEIWFQAFWRRRCPCRAAWSIHLVMNTRRTGVANLPCTALSPDTKTVISHFQRPRIGALSQDFCERLLSQTARFELRTIEGMLCHWVDRFPFVSPSIWLNRSNSDPTWKKGGTGNVWFTWTFLSRRRSATILLNNPASLLVISTWRRKSALRLAAQNERKLIWPQ